MRFFTRVNALSLIFFSITSLGNAQYNSDRAVGAQPPSRQNISNIDPKTILPQGIEPSAGCIKCTSSITFQSKKAADFQVGTQIPTLPFKTKQSWAGNIAIPDTPTTKGASLFFWLWGKDAEKAGNDLVIWMNGGPGCNSLIGMCTENGPFIFENENAQPNPYSWTTAANILYIAQPVGASFTTGFSSNSNEIQISQQFTLFLIEFFKVFPELASFNIWLTGESYMGQFAGFQWNAIKNNPLSKKFALKGGMLVSPLFSDAYTQVEVPVSTFVDQNKKALNISKKGLASIKAESKKCKLASFLRKYVAYPIRGRLPAVLATCDPFARYVKSTVNKDPTFNIYNIKNPLVQSINQPSAVVRFFNTASVQSYIHAPKQQFQVCKDVFIDGNVDRSKPVDRFPHFKHSLLAKMFEERERFIIMTGMLDGLLFSQGVQLALQNLTWAGVQGFMKAPTEALYDMEGEQKAFGTEEERKVRLVIVPEGGHMLPRDEPSLSLSALNALLGRQQWLTKT